LTHEDGSRRCARSRQADQPSRLSVRTASDADANAGNPLDLAALATAATATAAAALATTAATATLATTTAALATAATVVALALFVRVILRRGEAGNSGSAGESKRESSAARELERTDYHASTGARGLVLVPVLKQRVQSPHVPLLCERLSAASRQPGLMMTGRVAGVNGSRNHHASHNLPALIDAAHLSDMQFVSTIRHAGHAAGGKITAAPAAVVELIAAAARAGRG
jgi:hypothetical protein